MSKTVKIPRNVDHISAYTFTGAEGITSIIIPNTVSYISPLAFAGCSSLKNIYCEFAPEAISGAPWGAPAVCKVKCNAVYEDDFSGEDAGLLDTSDATAMAEDLLDGKIAYARGEKITGSIKTVSIPDITMTEDKTTGKIKATYTASAGYTSGGKKEKEYSLSVQAAKTYTPGISDQTIAAGKYLTGAQTIKGDSNLKAENISDGVSIFGISGTHRGSFYECAAVNDNGTWSGYLWTLKDGIYTKAATVTTGLPWTSVKPKVGRNYTNDGLIEILKLYNGFTVPEDGLVFACLMDNASTTATGESITNNGGVFQEYKGLPAVYMDGQSSLSIYSYNLDSIMGSNPCTMSCWLYFPEAQTMQDHPYYAFTYGNRGGGGESRCIGVHGDGSVKADTWNGATGGNVIGGWHHVCAIFASDMVNLYIDGELVSYGSCSLRTQSPCVYIGCTSSSDPQFIGYIGPCRIYNRELEDSEIMGLYKEYAG